MLLDKRILDNYAKPLNDLMKNGFILVLQKVNWESFGNFHLQFSKDNFTFCVSRDRTHFENSIVAGYLKGNYFPFDVVIRFLNLNTSTERDNLLQNEINLLLTHENAIRNLFFEKDKAEKLQHYLDKLNNGTPSN